VGLCSLLHVGQNTSSSLPRINIPLYRNSELRYPSVIPAQEEGRSYVVTSVGRGAVDAAASAREVRAGRVVPVSPKPRVDERRCQVRLADISMASAQCYRTPWRMANARTAKPCGPGCRCYSQVFAEVWSAQPGQPHRQFAKRGRPEGTRLPGERGIRRQPIAQGRPSVRRHLYAAVRSPCATSSRSGPRVPVGTRSSLRSLHGGGEGFQQNSGVRCREKAVACVLKLDGFARRKG